MNRARIGQILVTMTQMKTTEPDADVRAFLAAVSEAGRRVDDLGLDLLYRRVTGWIPRKWGPNIVGYGRYDYEKTSGRSGQMCATGFSPRKANMVNYIMPGYANFDQSLARLGKHKAGNARLYLGRLSGADIDVQAELVRAGLDDRARQWPVSGP